MASEAARQKYPDPEDAGLARPVRGYQLTGSIREAYDAGRANSLREAAESIRHKQHPESVRQMLNAMADRIESQVNEKEARG